MTSPGDFELFGWRGVSSPNRVADLADCTDTDHFAICEICVICDQAGPKMADFQEGL
jgi:hypothetical protein